ncbi:MAG: hypothetical protein JW941_09165 [Candidatus Coatesbacteria bacterium]|nr:hypothetical protein [Candidatus Coatesbacteria bacterium]
MKDWEGATARTASSKAGALFVLILGLLVPGGGHIYLGRRKKAAVLATIIIVTFFLGIYLNGRLYGFEQGQSGSETLINYIGALGGLGNGILYILAKASGFGEGNIEDKTFELGVAFLLSSGLFNILAAADAYRCSVGYDYDAAEEARIAEKEKRKSEKKARAAKRQSAKQVSK